MASTDFLPGTDAGMLAFAQNFSDIVTANPTVLGLTSSIATTYAGKASAYAAGLAASTNPATRGSATVFQKETLKRDLVAYTRLLARTIQGTLSVTDQQRHDLGLTVRVTDPTPIAPPADAPNVDVLGVSGRSVKIRLHQSDSATRRAKPLGVAGACVFSYVGASAPDEIGEWKFEGNITRTVVDVAFDPSVASGATVWICAQWYNPRAQNGPLSTPISTSIAGGLSQAA